MQPQSCAGLLANKWIINAEKSAEQLLLGPSGDSYACIYYIDLNRIVYKPCPDSRSSLTGVLAGITQQIKDDL